MINKNESEIYDDYSLCPTCGNKLLGGLKFCTRCGSSLDNSEQSYDTKSTSESVGPPTATAETLNNKGITSKNTDSKNSKVFVIVLAILLFVSIAINTYGYVQVQDKNSAISELQKDLAMAENKIESLETKALYYDAISSFLLRADSGYGSSAFRASEKIIVMKQTDSRRSFTLTANYNSYVTVSTSPTTDAATVDFSQSTWYGSSTKMYVTANYPGINVVTFSNSLDSATFRVMVVVTE